MTARRAAIIPMERSHVAACAAIAAAPGPWRRLGEGIDFPALLRAARPAARPSVCVASGAVAGFVVFTPFPVFARGGYLRAIAVAPGLRRRGVGKMLLAFAERETARNADHLYLCVSSFNRHAQAFYRKCGYRKVGSVPGLIRPGMAEQIYWKRLRSRPRRPARAAAGRRKRGTPG